MDVTSASVYGDDGGQSTLAGSPTPDQEYYEISSCKSHIFGHGAAPIGAAAAATLRRLGPNGGGNFDGLSRTSSFYGGVPLQKSRRYGEDPVLQPQEPVSDM